VFLSSQSIGQKARTPDLLALLGATRRLPAWGAHNPMQTRSLGVALLQRCAADLIPQPRLPVSVAPAFRPAPVRAAMSVGFAARTLSASSARRAAGATSFSLYRGQPGSRRRQIAGSPKGDWVRPRSYLYLGEFGFVGGGGLYPILQRCNAARAGKLVRVWQDLGLRRHRIA
jgi:hypothetical protein